MNQDARKIVERMAEYLKLPIERLDGATELANIIPDSFMLVELLIELQEEYGVRLLQSDVQNVKTVSDLAALIAVRAQNQDIQERVE